MAIVITPFFKFFQDYINLCQSNNWPNDETTLEEIRNSFLISQHIEKCLDKLQQKCFIDEFLSALNKDQNTSSLFLKQCFSDPPKYILKKIINSSTNISLMDAGFSIFLELFSETKLEMCLSDFILEAASKETLLKNLVHQFPKDILLEFKSVLFLSEIHGTKNSCKIICEMLENCTRDTMDILLLSLLNKDIKYHREVSVVLEAFISFMSKKKDWMISQNFWNVFFHTEITIFLKICLHHANIFKHLSKILVDCGQLIQENMSLDFFYINLTHSELSIIVKTICSDENLKLEFFDIIQELNQDASFWNNLLST